MSNSHRALLEDGPHAGVRNLPGRPQEMVTLIVPGTAVLRPATEQRYRRCKPHPDDFVNGYEARYRWDP